MNPTAQPYDKQHSGSKLSHKTCHHLKWLTGTATMRDTWEIKQCVNQLMQEQTKQQETLVDVISILNIKWYAAQVNSQKLNEIIDDL